MNHQFTHSIPINGKKMKGAFMTMTVVLILCIVAYILSIIFWDDYTYQAYSLKHGRNVTSGWPTILNTWGLWLGIGILVFLPIMYFMQDWKNPSVGITSEGLFVNQQMLRNVLIPFSNIDKIEKKGDAVSIVFKNNEQVYSKAGMFKPFIKSNLEGGGLSLDNDASPELDKLFELLQAKIS